jgi:hypothetical protein
MQEKGTLPSLENLYNLIFPDEGIILIQRIFLDTNYMSHLFSTFTTKTNVTIELTKSLIEKLERGELEFKSSREIEWAVEILGYGFIPVQANLIREDKHYLRFILNLFEYILCEEVDLYREIKSKYTMLKVSAYLFLNSACT